MKNTVIVLGLFALCLSFDAGVEVGRSAIAQENVATKFDMRALKATAAISNRSGARIVADFYASSEDENVAISPPTMVSTYAALAAISKGKTKTDLHKLLFLSGSEKPSFAMLGDYLHNKCGKFKSNGDTPCTYMSGGCLLVRTDVGDLDQADRDELFEKYETDFMLTDFSETDIAKINSDIAQNTDSEEFRDVITASPDMALAVFSAMSLFEGWAWKMKSDTYLPFKFDSGREEIAFLQGNVRGYQDVSVNNKSGYLFSLGASDLIIVQCKNGTELKRFAKTIAGDGLQVQSGRKILRQAKLHIPMVDFKTEFDFREYAIAKGCATPFREGAEYTVVSDEYRQNGGSIFCGEAKVKSSFCTDENGFTLKQVTYATAYDSMETNQRLRNNIIIDSPYLVVLIERSTNAILGMAFIASPRHEN